MMAIGTNARLDDTFKTVACGFVIKNGSNEAVIRIGPSRLVVTVNSASATTPIVRCRIVSH